ncbi:MAG: hypothetical protein EZS28_053372, partial [Streblomastix strix]
NFVMSVPKEYNVVGGINGLGQDIILDLLTQVMNIVDLQQLIGTCKKIYKLKDHPRFHLIQGFIRVLSCSSAAMITKETHDDDFAWKKSEILSFTFDPENCSIHINANVFRKSWDHKGGRYGFHHKHYTYRQWADVSVTIPDG